MKLRDVLLEIDPQTGYTANSGRIGTWTSGNKFGSYRTNGSNASQIYPDDEPEKLDPHIEDQLIQQGIDLLLARHPELVKNKTIRRHHIQMLIGNITSGEVNDLITLKRMIKGLKKRNIKVE